MNEMLLTLTQIPRVGNVLGGHEGHTLYFPDDKSECQRGGK